MFPAAGDFTGGRVAVAPASVARITSHQIGDENALKADAFDHPAQQLPRTIAAERNTRAVSAQAARRNSNEHYIGRNATIPWHHTRAAANQGFAAHARLNFRAQPQELCFRPILGGGERRRLDHRSRPIRAKRFSLHQVRRADARKPFSALHGDSVLWALREICATNIAHKPGTTDWLGYRAMQRSTRLLHAGNTSTGRLSDRSREK